MQVEIASPDPQWPQLFADERARLEKCLGSVAVAIEHIGSTSVPGLPAKPVVDIQVGVISLDDFKHAHGVQKLQTIGYEYLPDFESMVPFRRLFTRSINGIRANNLHLVAVDHPWWRRHLMFRDYLRQNPTARDRYAATKLELSQLEWSDVNAYAGAKTDIVIRLEEEAFDHFDIPDPERQHIRSSRV